MAKKQKTADASSPVAELEKRIAALKEKVSARKDAQAGDPAGRALRKKLRRAQRRRRSLVAFGKSLEARRAGRKPSTAAPAAPPAPAAE